MKICEDSGQVLSTNRFTSNFFNNLVWMIVVNLVIASGNVKICFEKAIKVVAFTSLVCFSIVKFSKFFFSIGGKLAEKGNRCGFVESSSFRLVLIEYRKVKSRMCSFRVRLCTNWSWKIVK